MDTVDQVNAPDAITTWFGPTEGGICGYAGFNLAATDYCVGDVSAWWLGKRGRFDGAELCDDHKDAAERSEAR